MLMKTFESRRSGGGSAWVGWLALVWVIGCGPTDLAPGEPLAEGHTAQPLEFDNGLVLNGLVLNGLVLNGLVLNGLNLNGLATSDFSSWFEGDPAMRDEVMKYLVACAVPAGEARAYTDATNTPHRWQGLMGLAANWSAGNRATEEELQVVSACMAAHANKYGIHVTISLRGRDGAGNALPFTLQEHTNYNVREACFFGNLFDGQTGVFSGNDGLTLGSQQSTARVCGLPGASASSQCAPLTFVGSCATYCTYDSAQGYYTSCTYNGVTYRPLVTRMKSVDIYSCGNGRCDPTESCGTGTTPDNCAADCGACR